MRRNDGMAKITDKKSALKMSILFMLIYMVSYITRINYGAIISEIISAENIKGSLASLAVTGSFITYGVGQLISGYLGEKIQPKKLIVIGFFTTTAMNLLIPICNSPYQMTAVWSINGFAQAFMWPPLVKLMTEVFDEAMYKKSCVLVSWGSSFGTILVYLAGPMCIHFLGWRSMFYFCAGFALVMVCIWMKFCPDIEQSVRVEDETKNVVPKKSSVSVLIIFVMIAIVLQGMLRDGVTTWMPSYIIDTFNLESESSILTGVCLPLFSILAFKITSLIYEKKEHNEVRLSSIIFFVGFVCAMLLVLFNGKSPIISVGFSALLTGCMHGINLMLVCMLPAHFKKSGNVSFMSGLLNFCTYVGSAVATYGIAAVSEKAGWNVTLCLWGAVAFAGGIICLTITKKWNKFCNE